MAALTEIRVDRVVTTMLLQKAKHFSETSEWILKNREPNEETLVLFNILEASRSYLAIAASYVYERAPGTRARGTTANMAALK